MERNRVAELYESLVPVLKVIEPPSSVEPWSYLPGPCRASKRCQASFDNFKSFVRDAATTAVTHAFSIIRSHYPETRSDVLVEGFAAGTTNARIAELEEEVGEAARLVVDDVDLFTRPPGEATTSRG